MEKVDIVENIEEEIKIREIENPKKADKASEIEEIQNTDNEIQEIENEILLYGGGVTGKEHPCDQCEKTFAKSQSLWLHQKKTHKSRKRKHDSLSKDSGAKKVKLDEETKGESGEEEDIAQILTAADLEILNLEDEKEEEAENEEENGKLGEEQQIVKSKKRNSRKGKKAKRHVAAEVASASSDEELNAAENFEKDETGKIGNIEEKKISKETVVKESESENQIMTKESVLKESEYFSVHTQVGILSTKILKNPKI